MQHDQMGSWAQAHHCLSSAYSKQACAKPRMLCSVLYLPTAVLALTLQLMVHMTTRLQRAMHKPVQALL